MSDADRRCQFLLEGVHVRSERRDPVGSERLLDQFQEMPLARSYVEHVLAIAEILDEGPKIPPGNLTPSKVGNVHGLNMFGH